MSLEGHRYESHKKASELIHNQNLKPNLWHLIISFSKVYTPETVYLHKKQWNSITKKMQKRGVEAHYERELNRKNQIHLHMLINSQQTEKQVLQILRKCMPYTKPGHQDGWRKFIEPVEDFGIINYVVKAKIKEYSKDGKLISHDKYAKKRLLFKNNLGLCKHGFIGKYWIDTKAKRKSKEKKINQGKKDSRITEYAEHVFEMVQGDSEMNLYQVTRNFALHDVRDPLKKTCTEYDNEDLSSKNSAASHNFNCG